MAVVLFGLAAPQAQANHHSGSHVPSWYINPHSPHITRAQALALTAPVTGHPSSTAPSAGSPDPTSTSAYLAGLKSQYTVNPQAFAATSPQYAALFRDQALIAAGQASSVSGLLPTTPLWNYLRFRRSLDPARFDFYHPRIGPLLDLDQRIRNELDNPQLPQEIVPPPPGGGGGGEKPPVIPPVKPPVPEPSSVILFMTGIAAMAWYLVSHERRRGFAVRTRIGDSGDSEVATTATSAGSFTEAFDAAKAAIEPSPSLAGV